MNTLARPAYGGDAGSRLSSTRVAAYKVSSTKTGFANGTASSARFATAFWLTSLTVNPVTTAMVNIELTSWRPKGWHRRSGSRWS